jgi:glycosyltransferase involved in cell wall biosynthesis
MRILQIVDSLSPGGAERMALNLTNCLIENVEYSAICVTRKEGLFKQQLRLEAGYLFLDKKRIIDFKAIMKLNKFLRVNKIDIIHVHGSSYFFGCLVKFLNPKVKLIWHDHFGDRASKTVLAYPTLFICSYFFNGVISVNKDILKWAKTYLLCSNTTYIPNFLVNKFYTKQISNSSSNIWNLISVANLKSPKNHISLLIAFKLVLEKYPNSNLYLIGKNYRDEYEKKIRSYIDANKMNDKVILTGELFNVNQYLEKAHLAILSSTYEGLPMVLLEYGMAALPVVSTNVGECSTILRKNGKIVEVNQPEALADSIICYLENDEQRQKDALNFHKYIVKNYSSNNVIPIFLKFYKSLNKKSTT